MAEFYFDVEAMASIICQQVCIEADTEEEARELLKDPSNWDMYDDLQICDYYDIEEI